MSKRRREVWLIGRPELNLPHNVLPTFKEVLRTYFYNIHVNGATSSESVKLVVDELLTIWGKARIPTALHQSISRKLKLVIDEYNLLKKNKSRTSDTYALQIHGFEKRLLTLFDIAHKESNQLIPIEEDRKFLEDQRTERKMGMAGIDRRTTALENRRIEREHVMEQRIRKENIRQMESQLTEQASSQSPLKDEAVSVIEELGPKEEGKCSKVDDLIIVKLPRNICHSQKVCQMADRHGISDRKVFAIVGSVLSSSSNTIDEFVLSPSSVHRSRTTQREVLAAKIKSDFRRTTANHFVVHWDGKIVEEFMGIQKERIAIIVTNSELPLKREKLLSIDVADSGSGVNQANIALSALQNWKIQDKVVAMCFDTTSSNTGKFAGAAVIIERGLNRKLLWLACRHHTFELILKAVGIAIFGKSSGPTSKEFKDFCDKWDTIDVTKRCVFNVGNEWLCLKRNEVSDSLSSMLLDKNIKFIRDNYRELAELTLIILGVDPPRGVHFLKPGAHHHARWMASVLYYIKMYLFSHQMGYSDSMIEKLRRMISFISLFYSVAWLNSPLATEALVTDKKLYNDMHRYRHIDQQVADVVVDVLNRHQWYMTAELAPFGFFSSTIDQIDKESAAAKLLQYPPNLQPGKPDFPKQKITASTTFRDFIGGKSWLLFKLLDVKTDWLSLPFPLWSANKDYNIVKNCVEGCNVVNDPAERSVKLMEDFANKITTNEVQRQELLQCVEYSRKNAPQMKKSIF